VTKNPGEDRGAVGVVTLEDVVEVSLLVTPAEQNMAHVPSTQELIGKEIIVSTLAIVR
jgi:hypothetical protein